MIEDLVSIIVPCYNHEKYIQYCLDSIISQTYQNIELLICDDNSTDNSYEIICKNKDRLEKRFKRLLIIKNEINLGVCKTLNKLIKMSKGKYIKTIASDDMLKKNCIADYVAFIQHDDCDIIFGNLFIVGKETVYPVLNEEKLETFYKKTPIIDSNLTSQLCYGNFISGASQFFKKDTFNSFGLYDEKFCLEDWEYCLRVSITGKIKYLDKVTVYYRKMEGTLSHYADDEKSIRRHRTFYYDKLSILKKYYTYSTKQSRAAFFSSEIKEAIVLNDKKLIEEILQEVNNGFGLNYSSAIRLFFYRLGIYQHLRTVKNMFRHRKR